MAMDKAYLDFHRARTLELAKNFGAKDIYNLAYDVLEFNKETQQYECYGYIFYHYGNEYFVVDIKDKDKDCSDCYKALFHSIDELNGFICALYKVYHKQITPR